MFFVAVHPINNLMLINNMIADPVQIPVNDFDDLSTIKIQTSIKTKIVLMQKNYGIVSLQ